MGICIYIHTYVYIYMQYIYMYVYMYTYIHTIIYYRVGMCGVCMFLPYDQFTQISIHMNIYVFSR